MPVDMLATDFSGFLDYQQSHGNKEPVTRLWAQRKPTAQPWKEPGATVAALPVHRRLRDPLHLILLCRIALPENVMQRANVSHWG